MTYIKKLYYKYKILYLKKINDQNNQIKPI